MFRQACLKVNPATAPAFFAEMLSDGGSIQYGLGSAVEEARRFGVLLLPPCVNHSDDRFVVEPAIVENRGTIGASDGPCRWSGFYCRRRMSIPTRQPSGPGCRRGAGTNPYASLTRSNLN